MGRAADSLERPCHSLEPKPRSSRREDSEFSRRGFGEASSGARLFLRSFVGRNRATHDLPFRADRNGLEHVAVALLVEPAHGSSRTFAKDPFAKNWLSAWLVFTEQNSSLRNSRTCSHISGSAWRRTELNLIQLRIHAVASQQFVVRTFFCHDATF
jgi:hypothetical protein